MDCAVHSYNLLTLILTPRLCKKFNTSTHLKICQDFPTVKKTLQNANIGASKEPVSLVEPYGHQNRLLVQKDTAHSQNQPCSSSALRWKMCKQRCSCKSLLLSVQLSLQRQDVFKLLKCLFINGGFFTRDALCILTHNASYIVRLV